MAANGLRPQMGAFRRTVMAACHSAGVVGFLPQDSLPGMVHRAMMDRAVVAVSVAALRECSGSEAGEQGADAAQRQSFCYCKCHCYFLLDRQFAKQVFAFCLRYLS